MNLPIVSQASLKLLQYPAPRYNSRMFGNTTGAGSWKADWLTGSKAFSTNQLINSNILVDQIFQPFLFAAGLFRFAVGDGECAQVFE